MVRTMKFVFPNSFLGKSAYQNWEGINWYINTVKMNESQAYQNIYLGAVPDYTAKNGTEPYFIVELTASTQDPNNSSQKYTNGKNTIPKKQAFKVKYNKEICLGTETHYNHPNEWNYSYTLIVTINFHCIRKFRNNSLQCDLLPDIYNYHSIPEKQVVQVKNGSDYIKFPNCKFGDPSFKKSDLVILIGDFQFFCHSQILSLNSPFFSDKIDQSMEENKKKEGKYVLELSDIDNIVDFQNFLYLIYNPRYTPNAQNVENILNYADKFQVDVVKEACEDFLLNGTHSFPVETLVAIAWRFNLKKLKKLSRSF